MFYHYISEHLHDVVSRDTPNPKLPAVKTSSFILEMEKFMLTGMDMLCLFCFTIFPLSIIYIYIFLICYYTILILHHLSFSSISCFELLYLFIPILIEHSWSVTSCTIGAIQGGKIRCVSNVVPTLLIAFRFRTLHHLPPSIHMLVIAQWIFINHLLKFRWSPCIPCEVFLTWEKVSWLLCFVKWCENH